jgi:hypothetical protein
MSAIVPIGARASAAVWRPWPALALLVAGCGEASPAVDPPAIDVTVQIGSPDEDGVNGAAAGAAGEVYLAGYAMAALPGCDAAGGVDVFLARVGDDGAVDWLRQYGTPDWDQPFAIAVGPDGAVYVTGGTFGDLAGHAQIGAGDVFLSRFTAGGDEVWTEVWGTAEEDIGYAVGVDGEGAVYVAGWTAGALGGESRGETDNFLTRLDPDGNQVWSRQWGNAGFDDPAALAVDGDGDVYVTGMVAGGLDGNPAVGVRDAFVTRFAGDGSRRWTRQFGHGDLDAGRGVAVDGDAVYVTGWAVLPGSATLAADVFLTRLDREGELAWSEVWGTDGIENGWAVAVDAGGDVLVTGKTDGDLDGNPNAGGWCGDFPCTDVYLGQLDPDGARRWTRQWGSDGDDAGGGVAVGASGTVFVAGATGGALGGPSAGSTDAFVTLLRPAAD